MGREGITKRAFLQGVLGATTALLTEGCAVAKTELREDHHHKRRQVFEVMLKVRKDLWAKVYNPEMSDYPGKIEDAQALLVLGQDIADHISTDLKQFGNDTRPEVVQYMQLLQANQNLPR